MFRHDLKKFVKRMTKGSNGEVKLVNLQEDDDLDEEFSLEAKYTNKVEAVKFIYNCCMHVQSKGGKCRIGRYSKGEFIGLELEASKGLTEGNASEISNLIIEGDELEFIFERDTFSIEIVWGVRNIFSFEIDQDTFNTGSDNFYREDEVLELLGLG